MLSLWCSISTDSLSSGRSPSSCSATASLWIFCSQLDRSTLKARSTLSVHRVDERPSCPIHYENAKLRKRPTSPCCDLLTSFQDFCRTSSLTPASIPPHPLLLEHYKSAERQTVILIAARACWLCVPFSRLLITRIASHVLPSPPLNLPPLTCAVGLSRVRGEAHHLQVRKLWGHVVFPGNHQWGRTQVDFVQHQDHLLLELSCDIVVQGRGELQDLSVDMSIVLSIYGCTRLFFDA